MLRTFICATLCIAWLVSLIRCQQISGGPDNVIATSSHEVALFCNRSASINVQWKFRPPGSDQEQDIPGRYRLVKTNYGVNSLVLENVQLSNAGTYVCRSVGSDTLKPAGAFLVAIAQKPCCHVDGVNSTQSTLTCSVTYAGQMDASLSLLAEGNGTSPQIIETENITTQLVASTGAVTAVVPASTVQQTRYRCRVSFFSTHSHLDVAKNQPGFVEGTCYVPVTRLNSPASNVNGKNLTSQTTDASPGNCSFSDVASEDTESGNSVVIGLYVTVGLILLLLFVIIIMAIRRRLGLPSFPRERPALTRLPEIFRHLCGDAAAGTVKMMTTINLAMHKLATKPQKQIRQQKTR